MALEYKIKELKDIISQYETTELLTFIAGLLIQIGKIEDNPFFKNLKSPMRQLFFLAALNLEQDKKGEKRGFSEKEWDKVTDLLDDIEMEYFYMLGWPKKGAESAEEIERIQVSMSTFMNYFFNGPLTFIEQDIERIEHIFSPFQQEIVEQYGVTVKDLIDAFDFLNAVHMENLKTATFLMNNERWQEFTSACISKGITDPKDWMNESPEMVMGMARFMANPGSILTFDIETLSYENLDKEKLIRILSIFTCQPTPKKQTTFYTDMNMLFEHPFLKIGETEYLMFFLKQYLSAIYTKFWSFCTSINKERLLKSRDNFLEQKVYTLFKDFFGKDAYVYLNYNIDNRISEQDVLVLSKGTAIIIEVKATAQRPPMRDPIKAFDKIKSDFKSSIQYGYDQTYRVKNKFLENENFNIYNSKGEVLYAVPVKKYKNVFSIIVTLERYGMIQTNLAEMLILPDNDEYPWSVNIDDLEAFLLSLKKRPAPIQNMINFLASRQHYHEHVLCGDELELCGSYLNNPMQFKEFSEDERVINTAADLSSVIDKEYYTGLGFKNERFFKEKRDRNVRDFFLKV